MVQMDDKCNVVCGNPGEPQCLIARSRRVCPYQSYTNPIERVMARFPLDDCPTSRIERINNDMERIKIEVERINNDMERIKIEVERIKNAQSLCSIAATRAPTGSSSS